MANSPDSINKHPCPIENYIPNEKKKDCATSGRCGKKAKRLSHMFDSFVRGACFRRTTRRAATKINFVLGWIYCKKTSLLRRVRPRAFFCKPIGSPSLDRVMQWFGLLWSTHETSFASQTWAFEKNEAKPTKNRIESMSVREVIHCPLFITMCRGNISYEVSMDKIQCESHEITSKEPKWNLQSVKLVNQQNFAWE